jgi:ABC-type uncharacterized transport system ATPase subunit
MPEERGLYPCMKVGEQLRYFARLHGMSEPDARASADAWMKRLSIYSNAVLLTGSRVSLRTAMRTR